MGSGLFCGGGLDFIIDGDGPWQEYGMIRANGFLMESHSTAPMPPNELERILELSDYGLDYNDLQDKLGGLTELAAEITGARISMINLIDHYTQWTVARTGTELSQMPREESVCQHTIAGGEPLEIADLKTDSRTRDREYVKGRDGMSYYYGLPLTNRNGVNLGALCVVDMDSEVMAPEQVKQLQMLAREVIARLELMRERNNLLSRLRAQRLKNRKISHDIRGPVGGIIGVAEIMSDQLDKRQHAELTELAEMVRGSGQSVLDLVDGILAEPDAESNSGKGVADGVTLQAVANSAQDLFRPQAKSKGVSLDVVVDDPQRMLQLARHQLLQICGNLISNAIKYTPAGGQVTASIGFSGSGAGASGGALAIRVSDTGIGMSGDVLRDILGQQVDSQLGTMGERGYGLGLKLVQELVRKQGGRFNIESREGEGCTVEVDLPL